MVCFNPRTRDGCEHLIADRSTVWQVSIHAPVMGAKAINGQAVLGFGFNPRTRDGCETDDRRASFVKSFQSTHP